MKNLDLTKRKLLNLQFQSHAKTHDLSQAVNAGICLGDGWRWTDCKDLKRTGFDPLTVIQQDKNILIALKRCGLKPMESA